MLVLNYPGTYVFHRWHGTLIYWAIILLGLIVNTGFAKWLPKLEGFLCVCSHLLCNLVATNNFV